MRGNGSMMRKLEFQKKRNNEFEVSLKMRRKFIDGVLKRSGK